MFLINNEQIPISYSLDDNTKAINASGWDLDISPPSGIIEPKQKIKLDISVRASRPGELVQPVVIKCTGKVEPVVLNIKALARAMTVDINVENENGNIVNISDQSVNILDFGETEVNTKVIKTFNFVNLSEHAIEHTIRQKSAGKFPLKLSSETGIIQSLDKIQSTITYHPRKVEHKLKDAIFELHITHGQTFLVKFEGSSVPPGVKFSCTHHDFGPTFVYRRPMPLESKELVISNLSSKEISVGMDYKPPLWLDIEFEPVVLKPKSRTSCHVIFKPNKVGNFEDYIPFSINGTSTYKIQICGESTEMKIELRKKMKELKLGCIRLGEIVRKKISLINRAKKIAIFQLTATPHDPALQDQGQFFKFLFLTSLVKQKT